MRWLIVAILSAPAAAQREPGPTVGMPAAIEQLVLPGSELRVVPLEDERTPIVLRIREVFRHGDAFRYDLVYYGLEPGRYDLGDYLERIDGTDAGDLPAIPIEIRSVLAAGQIKPSALQPSPLQSLGGYRFLLVVGGVIWVVGLGLLLFVGRRRRQEAAARARPATLADRLRPTVEAAIAGTLPSEGLASLERLLVAYWRRRLDLDEVSAADAIIALRAHGEAGALLGQLETWLHHPTTADREAVDVAALLAPYQDLPADTLESAEQGPRDQPS